MSPERLVRSVGKRLFSTSGQQEIQNLTLDQAIYTSGLFCCLQVNQKKEIVGRLMVPDTLQALNPHLCKREYTRCTGHSW